MLPFLFLLSIAIAEIVMLTRVDEDVPSEEDWSQAAEFVRPRILENDLLVVAPGWLDPIMRLHFGDQIPISMASRSDASSFARIWEFSARSKRSAEINDKALVLEKRFGSLIVRLFTQEPDGVVTRFSDALPRAKREGHGRVPALGVHEIDFSPRSCVLVLPKEGETTALEFNEAIGGRLVGYVGIADVFTRRDLREPGRLQVLVNGEQKTELSVGVDDGWIGFEIETEPSQSAMVTLLFSASTKKRQMCFSLEARQ